MGCCRDVMNVVSLISVTQTSEAQRIEDKYTELNQLVEKFIEGLYKEWAVNVSEASKFNLNQHLITRNPKNSLIQLNFHPQVKRSSPLSFIHSTLLSA